MNWKEKFKITTASLLTNEDIEQDFYLSEEGAKSKSLEVIKKQFPFIANDYLHFLSITDGADIAQCVLFNSTNYIRGIEMYSSEYSTEQWFPLGYEAGGDPILLHASSKVALGHAKNTSASYDFIANNFSDFLGEVLMGTNYPYLFRISIEEFNEFIERECEDDPWMKFLIEQKWLSLI